MIWKAKYTKADYAHGTTRLKRVFAWLPTHIDGDIVWLEHYEVLQVYEVLKFAVRLDIAKPTEATEFFRGQWTDISKRLINKK